MIFLVNFAYHYGARNLNHLGVKKSFIIFIFE